MGEGSWRVVIVTMVPAIAQGYTELLRALGHEPVAVLTPRSPMFAAEHIADDPEGLDLLFAAGRRSLAPLLRAHEPDLAVCTGFPWLIPADALEVPRLGIVNGHPSLLPRYRGPFPVAWAVRNGETEIGMSYHLMDAAFDTGNLLAQKRMPLDDDDTFESMWAKTAEAAAELLPGVLDRLARGDRGDPQEGGEYHSQFESDYERVDLTRPAAEVHRQVRAWGFLPPFARTGPLLERDGETVRIVRSSLEEVEGSMRLECADGPLWIVEEAPVQPARL
jgi:methionyl-tRNA formyltransferase